MEQILTGLVALLTFLQQHFIPALIIVTWHIFVFIPTLGCRNILPSSACRDILTNPLPANLTVHLGAASIIALLIAYALDNLNNNIMEIFQGYPFQRTWIGRCSSRRQESRRIKNEISIGLLKYKVEARRLAIQILELKNEQLLLLAKINNVKQQIEKEKFNIPIEELATEIFALEDLLRSNRDDAKRVQIAILENEQLLLTSKIERHRIQNAVKRDKLKIQQLLSSNKIDRPLAEYDSNRFDLIKNKLTVNISLLESDFLYCEQQRKLLFSSNYLLPTKLGNVVESFKQYSSDLYKIDAKIIYPRLAPLLTKNGHDKQIRQEKVKVDFFLNCALLLAFSSVEYCISLIYHKWLHKDWSQVFLVTDLSFLLLSWLCYKIAVAGALSWGNSVKTAFDLHRYELLKALNCKVPDNLDEEKDLWDQLSYFFSEGYFKSSEAELDSERLKEVLRYSDGKTSYTDPSIFDYGRLKQTPPHSSPEMISKSENA